MIQVQTKSARHLTEDEYDWCSRNNYGPSGSMYDEILHCRYTRPARNSSVTMIYKDDQPVAWSLRFRAWDGRWHLYLWVVPECRHMGFGRTLLARSRMGVRGPLVVYPGNNSRRLYRPLVETGRLKCAYGYSL
jgi:hypothetical protein